MSNVDPGPASRASTDQRPDAGVWDPNFQGKAVVLFFLLALANFAAFILMLLYHVETYAHSPQALHGNTGLYSDLAIPVMFWGWAQLLVNGLVLSFLPRTTFAGLGMLLAATVIAIAAALWVVLLLASCCSTSTATRVESPSAFTSSR